MDSSKFVALCAIFSLFGTFAFSTADGRGKHRNAFSFGTPEHFLTLAEDRDRPSTFYEREEMTFTINVVYKGAESGDTMGLRGNALGLSPTTSTPMTKTDDATRWTLSIKYKESEFGATCHDSSPCDTWLRGGDNLVFRAVLGRDGQEIEMRGYDYEIQFPLSMASPAFAEDQHPDFTLHPWFFSDKGEVVEMVVTSADPVVGSRRIEVYLPPSASENPPPVYDVVVGFDLNQDLMPVMAEVFDYEFAEVGRAKEAVVVGHGDFSYVDHRDRPNMLTPTVGIAYDCVEGTFPDGCNGCIPLDGSFEDYMNAILFEGCTTQSPAGGYADQSMDYVLDEVFPKVEDLLAERTGHTKLTNERDKTMLFGFSLGGLMTCYQMWTRPEVFGRGACQSASLWWPLSVDYEAKTWESAYFFLNVTLPTHLEDRPPQFLLMDVGATEEDETMHMVLAPQVAFEFMSQLPYFQPNRNLWFHAYPDQTHTYEAWIGRVWSVLSDFSIGRAYPN